MGLTFSCIEDEQKISGKKRLVRPGSPLSAVQIDEKWGYINDNKEIIVQPQYDDAF